MGVLWLTSWFTTTVLVHIPTFPESHSLTSPSCPAVSSSPPRGWTPTDTTGSPWATKEARGSRRDRWCMMTEPSVQPQRMQRLAGSTQTEYTMLCAALKVVSTLP
eukprot:CAMPEP_0173249462 /NCGR_PEP_ID=MMETSP1142-20121109/19034_1 /TAXON_ID=483371 /ORGANISM="non described non described, Strain CCMP2298" /LENGTH=104 /DNA_ID=CAMNT_0014182095 /DNA_START=613 /DNA_END=927 /DNA_ORIENTATION=+